MVCSYVGCVAAAQLLPLATHGFGDVDGCLLLDVESQRYHPGFTFWSEDGMLRLQSKPGLDLEKVEQCCDVQAV